MGGFEVEKNELLFYKLSFASLIFIVYFIKIYVAHSRSFDFKKELYEPIRKNFLNNEHTFILPHEHSEEPFNSKDYLKDEADLVIAEVSEPSTGLGIELGWADAHQVLIICI